MERTNFKMVQVKVMNEKEVEEEEPDEKVCLKCGFKIRWLEEMKIKCFGNREHIQDKDGNDK